MKRHCGWLKGYLYLKAILLFMPLLLSGCAEFNSGWNSYTPRYTNNSAQTDFDELLTFGDNLANSSSSARSKICKTLLKNQKGTRETAVVLHLMVGRLLSDSCGDISRLLEEIRAIPSSSLTDARLEKLIAINSEALKRMNGLPKKSVSADCRPKSNASASSSKGAGVVNKSENNLLREKLEAIRSMEKKMDESSNQ